MSTHTLRVLVLSVLFGLGLATDRVSAALLRPAEQAVEPSPSGRYLAGFAAGTSEADARAAASAVGLEPLEWIGALAVLVVRPVVSTDALGLLAALPEVDYVEADPYVRASDTPNDPDYAALQWAPQRIGAAAAWDLTTGSAAVMVAVLDTGLDPAHRDLAGKFVAGWDFVNSDADPSDDHGHGTHVAGIVGAATNNGLGVASIGRGTTILPGKVLDGASQGTHGQVAAGITWAADLRAKVINLSLAGTATSTTLKRAVEYAVDGGALVVAAAGNGNRSTPYYPAAYPGVMAVAATTSSDDRWGLSNFGAWISLAAPGASIRSTDWAGGTGEYATRSGTSQAAPHVAGAASLLLALDPGLTAAQLRSMLESTARDLGTAGRDDYFGAGRLDAAAAASLAAGVAASTPTSAPAPNATPTPVPAPVVTDVHSSNVARTSATIRWTTDRPATSQVEYGTTAAFGSLTAYDGALVTSHAVSLTGLSRNTTYSYRVRSRSSGGGETISASFTFRTKK